jgi:hypothetical protein
MLPRYDVFDERKDPPDAAVIAEPLFSMVCRHKGDSTREMIRHPRHIVHHQLGLRKYVRVDALQQVTSSGTRAGDAHSPRLIDMAARLPLQAGDFSTQRKLSGRCPRQLAFVHAYRSRG